MWTLVSLSKLFSKNWIRCFWAGPLRESSPSMSWLVWHRAMRTRMNFFFRFFNVSKCHTPSNSFLISYHVSPVIHLVLVKKDNFLRKYIKTTWHWLIRSMNLQNGTNYCCMYIFSEKTRFCCFFSLCSELFVRKKNPLPPTYNLFNLSLLMDYPS